MTWLIRFTNCAVATLFAWAQPAMAQSTASLSGRILSEEGRTLRATVTLSFATARGYPAPPHRTLTDAYGAFTFSHLAAGRYVL